MALATTQRMTPSGEALPSVSGKTSRPAQSGAEIGHARKQKTAAEHPLLLRNRLYSAGSTERAALRGGSQEAPSRRLAAVPPMHGSAVGPEELVTAEETAASEVRQERLQSLSVSVCEKGGHWPPSSGAEGPVGPPSDPRAHPSCGLGRPRDDGGVETGETQVCGNERKSEVNFRSTPRNPNAFVSSCA